MFQFLKKNNNRNNYYYPNQNPYNYQYYSDPNINQYDMNMIDVEIKELKRMINDINMRLNRIEGYIGIRDHTPSDY